MPSIQLNSTSAQDSEHKYQYISNSTPLITLHRRQAVVQLNLRAGPETEGGQPFLPCRWPHVVQPASSSSASSPSSAETRPDEPAIPSPTCRTNRPLRTPDDRNFRLGVFQRANSNPGSAIRPMAAMAAQNPPAEREKLGVPSRNPLPLSASQEAQVRDIYYQRVRSLCAEEIKAFAACALGRTFTVSFVCRPEHRVMNNCMKLHATQDEHDAARVEWFSMRLERQRERERKNKVAAAQEEFMREWWGLPEHVRLSRQKEMEQRGERIHGLTTKDRPPMEGEKSK